ncbi:pathogenesis-related protein PR-1 type-like [Cucumis melo var. makuwa]|nr:pathogenesis-related protein PR-1 type-like [Cucumis melo var. makuwa]TYK06840.1 pathogenesis-related protein PR-1 type-like [Cucumis melo var. makuwa]
MVHSVGPYGENLATANGVLTTAAAVNTWAAEEKYYNHNSNKCVGGKCRHYTQLVWKNSFLVGCATVKCKDNWSSVISCNYSPSRNVVGERPY